MRTLHRWMMLLFGVLIAYVAVTGVWLAVVDITDGRRDWAGDGGGPGSPTPTVVGGIDVAAAGELASANVTRMVATGLRAARAQSPDTAIAAMELSAANHQPRATVTWADAAHSRLSVDGLTGDRVTMDGEPRSGAGPSSSWHRTVKDWHRGNPRIAGPLGSAIGIRLSLAAGLVLSLLVLSGAYVYLTLWWKRRAVGRGAFFWRDRSVFAWLHRWVSVIAAVFILNQAVTGALLAWFNLSDPSTQTAGTQPPAGYSDAQVTALMQEVWQRGHAAAPWAPIIAVALMRNGSEPFGPVFYGGARAGAIGFRLTSNDYVFGVSGAIGPGGAAIDSHSLLKRIHRGDFIGHFSGRYLSVFAGVAVAWLLISGLVMYLQQRRRRSALRRAADAQV